MPSTSAPRPPKQPGRVRSAGGGCPACRAPFADLLEHIRKRHASHLFSSREIQGAGLVNCKCGTVCKNELGLRRHITRSGCSHPTLQPLPPRLMPIADYAPRRRPPPPESPPPTPIASITAPPVSSSPPSSRPPRFRFFLPGQTPSPRPANYRTPTPPRRPILPVAPALRAARIFSRSGLIPTQPQHTLTNSNRFSALSSEDDESGDTEEGVAVSARPAPVEREKALVREHEQTESSSVETPPWEGETDMDIDEGSDVDVDARPENGPSSERVGPEAVAAVQEAAGVAQEALGTVQEARRAVQAAGGQQQAGRSGRAGQRVDRSRRVAGNGGDSSGEDSGVGTDSDGGDNSGTLFHLGDADLSDIYLRLAALPTRHRPLAPAVAAAFVEAAERSADKFLAQPSDKAVIEFLGLPKVGLSTKNNSRPTHRLSQYPFVNFPPAPTPLGAPHPPSATRQVELGRLGHAARILSDRAAVAKATPDVVASLEEKHPAGPANAFGRGPGPQNHSVPDITRIREAIELLNNDSSAGISGWTPALLKTAIRSESVLKMLHSLCGMMLAGKAPGQSFLCSSHLIALNKADGGLRPIAIGESIYRVCMKVILKHTFKTDYLAPYQFGVGSKGGVEPIVRAVQRAAEGLTEQAFTHLTSLDFSNAFNTVDRKDIAAAVRRHASPLFRAAKWAYDKPARLIFSAHDGQEPPTILSSQGVRQGDPLGPLLFSLAIRPLLHDLTTSLGPDCTLLAYLDDIYILSKSPETLNKVARFFETNGGNLKLNLAKSSIQSLSDVKLTGTKMLGSFVGPTVGRARFLSAKIDKLEAKVQKLVDLPSQHSLLLLRQCIQQDLRHLQRTLKSDDLNEQWARLDAVIWDAAARIRAAQGERDSERDREVFRLPVKLGGLGLLSHQDCAPLAFATASESSDLLLSSLLGPPPSPPLLSDADNPKSIVPQRTRCLAMFTAQRDQLFSKIEPMAQQIMVESSSLLGRRWLNVIPFSQRQRLTDFEISAALHIRTLITGRIGGCKHCGEENVLGHDEVCLGRKIWRVARHEQVKRTITESLRKLPGVQVAMEPFIGETRRRNDIRVIGSREAGMCSGEYDVTVVSLATQLARSTFLPPRAEGVSLHAHATALVDKHVEAIGAQKHRALPAGGAELPFSAIVFTLGGRMDSGTEKEMNQWKAAMPDGQFDFLVSCLSLILLRARVRNFDL